MFVPTSGGAAGITGATGAMPGAKAVVKFSDFGDDVDALATHLRALARDEDAYAAYFAWRDASHDTPAARSAFQATLDMTAYVRRSLFFSSPSLRSMLFGLIL